MKAPNSKLQAPEKFQIPNIEIFNRQRAKKVNLRLLKEVIAAVLAELKIENAELEVVLVGAKEMIRLNEKFLRHKGSTDVITFDYGSLVGRDSRRTAKEKIRLARTLAPLNLNGEIFICVDEAIVQAKQFKTSWQMEVVRYVVHGVLHLLGHDDLKPHLRRKMKRAENRLVRRLAGRFSLAQRSGAAKLGA